MGFLGRYARKDLDDKTGVGFIFQLKTDIFFSQLVRMWGWVGSKNPYRVRILNPLGIIGNYWTIPKERHQNFGKFSIFTM